MNILMFSDFFGATNTTFIYNELRFLSSNNNVKYLCISKAEKPVYKYDDVEVAPFNVNKIKNKLRWLLWKKDLYLTFKDKKFSKNLNQIIYKFSPDIIHCHFAYEALKILDNLSKKNSHIPVVIHIHGYGASQMLLKQSYIKKLRFYFAKDNVYPIFVNNYFKQNFIARSIPVNKSIKLHCGIDVNFFKPSYRNKNNEFIFLQVSSLTEKKGHEYTIKAFAKFLADKKYKKYKLIITGKNSHRYQKLMALAQDLNIDKYIEFIGNVSHSTAKKLMNNADVYVHHSITGVNGDSEGIPTSIMEAMAMELPILSTIHAGIPELVENNVNGLLTEEKDIETYAENMNNILTWNKQIQNREKIKNYFEYAKHNQMLEKFYQKIISISEHK
ncbi:MAG TPA: glycosyltransferase family 4 protein [Victivallales bacterium]|nr:glycosyltransferase family 4 protein [Victivallales bacterium]